MAAEIKLWAERRAGELLAEMDQQLAAIPEARPRIDFENEPGPSCDPMTRHPWILLDRRIRLLLAEAWSVVPRTNSTGGSSR